MNKRKITYKTELPKQEEGRKFPRMLGVVILVFCLSVLSFVGGRIFQQYNEGTSLLPFWNIGRVGNIDRRAFNEGQIDEFNTRLFWDVWDTLQRNYVDESVLDEEEMFYGSIKGMVNSLGDPATIFLNPEEAEAFKRQSEGKYYEGIGAELGYRDGVIVVIAPITGSPAEKAGVLAGDTIVRIDGELVKQSDTVYDVVDRIRGDAGTEVVLTLMRRGETELLDISIVRGEITVPSMTLERDDDLDVYILKVSRFTDASLSKWTSLWDEKIDEFLESGEDRLILDLRTNPGGFFDAGVYAAGEFLSKGTVVAKQEDRFGRVQEYQVKRDGKLLDIEVVVLVNEGSASASEIFAGALQQNDRANIVGMDTYGKGTAQSVVDFSDGSSLHLTIVKWLLPDGSWINQENVVEPDFEVELTNEDFLEGNDPQMERAVELLGR
jgi:carboxyl-terminal processing protease